MTIIIRRATRLDLPGAYAIQQESSLDTGLEIGNVAGTAGAAIPAKFNHELEHGRFLVAEDESTGRLLGFGGMFDRENVSFLATFYVRPSAQRAGLGAGQRLLDGLFDRPGRTRCVVSSHIHRAIAVYARNDMLPRWPLYMLEGSSPGLLNNRAAGIKAQPAGPGDPGLVEIDSEIAGRGRRLVDQQYWVGTHCATPYWICRSGEHIGYGYIQDLGRSVDARWNGETTCIGPVGVFDPEDAAAAVDALVGIAREISNRVVIHVPGAHPALAVLFAAGFRIFYQAVFCCSAGSGPFDPTCYLPADTITL